MYYQATPTTVLMQKFRVQRHAHALDLTITIFPSGNEIIIEQASLAIYQHVHPELFQESIITKN